MAKSNLPALPSPAALSPALDRLCGSYRVEGDTGIHRFELVRRGTFLHAAGDRVGLALPWENRLVVVFGPLNKTEIGAYRVGKDASVLGMWVPPGADQADFSACGVELSNADDKGIWRITSAYAIDKSPYAGKIERSVMHGTQAAPPAGAPRAVHVTWLLEDGEFRSFALDYTAGQAGGAMYSMFCFEPEKEHGLAVYDLTREGLPAAGWSLSSTGRGLVNETLVRE
jgi:hypothetical protein